MLGQRLQAMPRVPKGLKTHSLLVLAPSSTEYIWMTALFFGGSSEPVGPLIQGKDPMEKSLLCAEKGIPNVVYGMPMSGATAPASFPGCLAIANAEVLSQPVVLHPKNPGVPTIYGSIPSIMDMRTTIFSCGAPEMTLMVGLLVCSSVFLL